METRALVSLPVGERLIRLLKAAYQARLPVLLEGDTGIGKSEILQETARQLGIGCCVLDLSLLEPPDLVGLPQIDGGRTVYAAPAILPQDGAGVLMLEELNRAERYMQQPALQLLTARKLHSYTLPEGWSTCAAINPEGEDYHVTPLDPALRARFLQVRVYADRTSWLAWAVDAGIHPAILGMAREHDRFFETIPPRTWTYASRLLVGLSPVDRADQAFLTEILGGYLPPSWVDVLLARPEMQQIGGDGDLFDPDMWLASADKDPAALARLTAWKAAGQTDQIDELCQRLRPLLQAPAEIVLRLEQKRISSASLHALLLALPGDPRESLQDALAKNPAAPALLPALYPPTALLENGFKTSSAAKTLRTWVKERHDHWLLLFFRATSAFLRDHEKLATLRKNNTVRQNLREVLEIVKSLPERMLQRFAQDLKDLGLFG
jgi:hypothetical protein